MLAIRMQRTGRSGHTQFRVIVQDSRFSPTRGRVVAYLGNYDPHTKLANIDSEKTAKYLENGAQPSDTVARLLKKEGLKLPAWVKLSQPQSRTTRNPDKRRSTRPAGPEAPVEEAAAEPVATESPAEVPAEEAAAPEASVAEAAPTEEVATEAPATAETASEEAPATAENPK